MKLDNPFIISGYYSVYDIFMDYWLQRIYWSLSTFKQQKSARVSTFFLSLMDEDGADEIAELTDTLFA